MVFPHLREQYHQDLHGHILQDEVAKYYNLPDRLDFGFLFQRIWKLQRLKQVQPLSLCFVRLGNVADVQNHWL